MKGMGIMKDRQELIMKLKNEREVCNYNERSNYPEGDLSFKPFLYKDAYRSKVKSVMR